MAAKRWAHTGAVRVCEHRLSCFKVPRRGPPQKFYDILKPRLSDIKARTLFGHPCAAWLGLARTRQVLGQLDLTQ